MPAPSSKSLDDRGLLKVLARSFRLFLDTGSRSTEKLKPLHGAIAADVLARLGEGYSVCSMGIGEGKEHDIEGRYIDKKVDITVMHGEKVAAGLAVKFVMQNYSQNSNNYFENMLGETANIRSGGLPYFQLFFIIDRLPYYDNRGNIKHWETFSCHNAAKYVVLSQDNPFESLHTPNKTLLYVVRLPETPETVKTKAGYVEYYKSLPRLTVRKSDNEYGEFERMVVSGGYEAFIKKVVHYILGNE